MGSGVVGPDAPPSLLSVQRFTTLVSSLVVALSSGTNYVYSAYAPQLGARLNISHTQLNVIGLAGNVGVYSTGPFTGKYVDLKGPKGLLVVAFVCLFAGYSGIRHFYNSGGSASREGAKDTIESGISTLGFCLLVFCSFLTGAGGNGGLTSGLNVIAKSFPDQMRASATGLVLSGFGLSAFLFSTIAHVFFPGDTSSLLLLLSIGASLPMIAGAFLVRPVPLPATGAPERATESHARLLGGHNDDDDEAFLSQDPGAALARVRPADSVELTGPSHRRHRSSSRVGHSRSSSRVIEAVREVSGRALFTSWDFWLLFTILSLLSGTGLMYINNVGSISQALVAKGNPNYDKTEAAKWQSVQVSTISVANCMGRVLLGLGADVAKNKFAVPRSFCISAVAAFFLISQLMATQVESAGELWKVSALIGLAYGGVFGVFPTITIDWFGLSHFSENWGFLHLSPIFGGNVFSIAFGRNLDRHAAPASPAPSVSPRAGVASAQQCFGGPECYVASLHMTIVACTVALVLAVVAGWRDRQRMAVPLKQREAPEVIWEEDEE